MALPRHARAGPQAVAHPPGSAPCFVRGRRSDAHAAEYDPQPTLVANHINVAGRNGGFWHAGELGGFGCFSDGQSMCCRMADTPCEPSPRS